MNRNKKGSAAPAKAANKKSQPLAARIPRPPASGRSASAAAAYATGMSSGKAQVYRSTVDSCRLVHRELVASVTGSVGFAVASNLSINPGLPGSFPWLSIEAQGWEKYRFNSLKLCYYTRTGTNVPGSVILAADYDAADAAPANEQIASAYYGTQEDAVWKDLCFVFDRARLAGERFIRTGGLSANQDVKTFDVANAFVATQDGTAVSWGKVWLEYDVTLINPQLPPGGPSGSGTLAAGGGTIAAATPFGAAPVALGSYALSAAGTNVVSFSGLSIGTEYCLALTTVGTVISAVSSSSVAPTGFTAVTVVGGTITAAALNASLFGTYLATATSGTITISITATTISATDLVFSAVPARPSF